MIIKILLEQDFRLTFNFESQIIIRLTIHNQVLSCNFNNIDYTLVQD